MVLSKVIGVACAGVPVTSVVTAVGIILGSSYKNKSSNFSENIQAPKANYPKGECRLFVDVTHEQEKLFVCTNGNYYLYSDASDSSTEVKFLEVINDSELSIKLKGNEEKNPIKLRATTEDKWKDFPKNKNLFNNGNFPCSLFPDNWSDKKQATWECINIDSVLNSEFQKFTFGVTKKL